MKNLKPLVFLFLAFVLIGCTTQFDHGVEEETPIEETEEDGVDTTNVTEDEITVEQTNSDIPPPLPDLDSPEIKTEETEMPLFPGLPE